MTRSAGFGVLLVVTACAAAPAGRVPAVLVDAQDVTLETVRQQLKPVLPPGYGNFGPGDPTENGQVSLLPPRPVEWEGNSLALPIVFDLFLEGDTCLAVERGGERMAQLPGNLCRVRS